LADIFISYSKQEPGPTEALAADVEMLGYTTWWDTSLLPGERFPSKIRLELEAAKVVIVIWSESSVKSEWVYAEAQLAQALSKLITVHVPGLDLSKVPLPFGARHIELVTNRSKLYAALEMFGVKPSSAAPTEDAEELYQIALDYDKNKLYAESMPLYRKAAEMGHAGALCRLGSGYYLGQGVPEDNFEAQRLLRRAADLGNPKAREILAEVTRVIAMKSANDLMESEAADLRAKLAVSRAQEAKLESMLPLAERAQKGDADAAYEVACTLEETGSLEVARGWYRTAAQLGHTKAAEALRRLGG
jgi:TPR repeat protein